ncbi:MAG: hypothetical protein N2204_00540 [Anaerolineae bacterium]|nr:hypothetical protein [Anaerolineae bacterium]
MCTQSWPARTLITLLMLLLVASACSDGPTLVLTPTPEALPSPPAPVSDDILTLPTAFHYEMTLRPADSTDEPPTVIAGVYRDGTLAQTTRLGDAAAEELTIAADPVDGVFRSFTRAAGQDRWTRWPGVGFDAFYGLASPFSPLRLHRFVSAQNVPTEPEALPDAPTAVFKTQVVFSPQVIEQLLKAGAEVVATTPEAHEALMLQLAPLVMPQTITYWAGEDNRVYRAAATLQTSDAAGRAVPWLEATWRYWGYDDPAIAIATPGDFEDAAGLSPEPAGQAATAAEETSLAPDTTLRVRVFANPGQPATDVQVIVYPAGKKQTLATQRSADAQFALPAGLYDVFVQAGAAWKWLRSVAVSADGVSSHDVLFDFGTLKLTVTHEGVTPQVDIVIYPAGQPQEWLDWRTENPTALRLPAGLYDVEVALPDLSATRRVTGIEIKPGGTTEITIALDKP